MFLKERKESKDLLKMRYLRPRMPFASKDEVYYWRLEKGYKGELQFDRIIREHLPGNKLIVNDLLLQQNQTYFQIDSLIFSQSSLYLIDVKTFEKDIYVEGDKWKSVGGTDINNPLHQLERCAILLQKVLHEKGYRNLPIRPYLIFIHPQFTLFNAPLNPSIILPTQIPRFLDQLKKQSSMIADRDMKLLRHLINLHIVDPPITNVPHYQFESLQKGLICSKCTNLIDAEDSDPILVCPHCGTIEKVESAILRSVEELRILFPDQAITTNVVYEWCGGVRSKKTVQRILYKNFKSIARGPYSYYE